MTSADQFGQLCRGSRGDKIDRGQQQACRSGLQGKREQLGQPPARVPGPWRHSERSTVLRRLTSQQGVGEAAQAPLVAGGLDPSQVAEHAVHAGTHHLQPWGTNGRQTAHRSPG